MTIRKGATRISATIDKDIDSEIKLLAKKHGMSKSEWLVNAINIRIEEEHSQFGVAGLAAQRLNQIQDAVVNLTKRDEKLAQYIEDLIKMMTTLVSGESYLDDDEDEE